MLISGMLDYVSVKTWESLWECWIRTTFIESALSGSTLFMCRTVVDDNLCPGSVSVVLILCVWKSFFFFHVATCYIPHLGRYYGYCVMYVRLVPTFTAFWRSTIHLCRSSWPCVRAKFPTFVPCAHAMVCDKCLDENSDTSRKRRSRATRICEFRFNFSFRISQHIMIRTANKCAVLEMALCSAHLVSMLCDSTWEQVT